MDRTGPKWTEVDRSILDPEVGAEAHQCDPLRIHSGSSARRRSASRRSGPPKWAVGGGDRSGPDVGQGYNY